MGHHGEVIMKMAYPNNVQTKNTIYKDVNYIQKLFYAKAGTNNFL